MMVVVRERLVHFYFAWSPDLATTHSRKCMQPVVPFTKAKKADQTVSCTWSWKRDSRKTPGHVWHASLAQKAAPSDLSCKLEKKTFVFRLLQEMPIGSKAGEGYILHSIYP